MAEAEIWLEAHTRRRPTRQKMVWGEGSDSVALFKNLTDEEERLHLDALRKWQQVKSDAGYGSIEWPEHYGGAGLSPAHATAFARLENEFETPTGHETIGVTLDLMAPTIRKLGTEEQKLRYLRPMRRTDELWCQLFSEPEAGSDLASVSTRAEQDGAAWVLNGQKVWTSGAQFADFGLAICRTDPGGPRHRNLTAFIIPMDTSGVEVRPLRQMTGGTSFNEVYLTDVRIADRHRVSDVGSGWQTALTTLGFERAATTKAGVTTTEMFNRLVLAARHLGRTSDPAVRQELAKAYIDRRVRSLTSRRVAARLRSGDAPGPEGSIGKLAWTDGLRRLSQTASSILGPQLIADSGEWGTFAWAEMVTGVPGFRIAGGSDEIQRNIIAERVLGLPRS